MENRRRERTAKRITCTLESGVRRATGIVHNFSDHGLFIQTNFGAPEDSLVHVVFPLPDRGGDIRIEAGVARKRIVSRQLQVNVPSGLGLEVIPPLGDFERVMSQLAPLSLQGAACPSASSADSLGESNSIHSFRFKMIRHNQPGSKILTIQSATAASARARAVARLGAGWKIAESQRL